MHELKNLVNQVIQEIYEIADYLYQQKTSKGYEALNSTLGKIMNIADKLLTLSGNNPELCDGERLIGNLNMAMQAMEQKDGVLLADLLTYEVAGQLQEIEQAI